MCTEEQNLPWKIFLAILLEDLLSFLHLKLPLKFKRLPPPVSVVTQLLSEFHQSCQHLAIHLSENCMNCLP